MSESYEVSAVEFAALDALGEVFRQLVTFERSLRAGALAGGFTLIIAGAVELDPERAAALSAWWRTLHDDVPPLDELPPWTDSAGQPLAPYEQAIADELDELARRRHGL